MRQEQYQKAMNSSTYREFSECFNSGCTRCSLCEHDNHPVVWRGNPDSKIMLIGEAPGAKEDQNGKPFSGPAGKLLDNIFRHVCGMDTNHDMLLTNVVFCRPVAPADSGKQNYTPKKEQTVRCWPFVERSIDLLKPKVIVACGRTALCALMDDDSMRMNTWEGRWLERKGVSVFVMLHPAALLYMADDPVREREAKLKVQKYMYYFKDTYRERLNG